MSQPTRAAKPPFRGAAPAALMLLAALLLDAPASAVEPTATWTSASAVANPAARCDLKPAAQIERLFERGLLMPLSSYDDDPFVQDSNVECLPGGGFARNADGRRVLANSRVTVADEDYIYRLDTAAGTATPFAWNPWPIVTSTNADGSFRFPDEPRFPTLVIERGSDGKPILRDGLQVWRPFDLNRGATTVFEAANSVKDASEDWAGRSLPWGVDGNLFMEPHAFIDFNAEYSPFARMIFFGVAAYRFPNTTDLKIFETATSWEMAAHESAHAVLHVLKPNAVQSDLGMNTWRESFADQTQMWTQLRDPGRVRSLLAGPSLSQSNSLSQMVEAWGALIGTPGGMRDAVNDATLSNTSDEVHDRSEVMTGAAYRLFVSIYDELRGHGEASALEQASSIMGIFLMRVSDYTPEDRMSLEDVAKSYLKVDAELFGGRYRDRLIDEFQWREIFDAHSVDAWQAHEAGLPDLRLAFGSGQRAAEQLVRKNLDRLGVGPDFGLVVQSVTRDERFRRTIVRVQLTQGRSAAAALLDNHGVLVFRGNGTLADYHAALPDGSSSAEAVAVLEEARVRGLDAHGAPLSIVRNADGALAAEARILRGDGPTNWVDAFTVDAPQGERREIASAKRGSGRQADLIDRAGIVLGDEAIAK